MKVVFCMVSAQDLRRSRRREEAAAEAEAGGKGRRFLADAAHRH